MQPREGFPASSADIEVVSADVLPSRLRVEKRRSEALVRLTNGSLVSGCFFVAGGSARHAGPERIGDLLNGSQGFVPFEQRFDAGMRTVLYNRAHIVTVTLSEDEASRDPGYVVAPKHEVSLRLSTGETVDGTVRVYQPEGHDRVSDWAREPEMFRYVESHSATLLVNTAHIVEISESPEP